MPNIKLSQKNISLDLQHIGYVNTIYAQQGDENARKLTIYLFDDGEEYLIPNDASVSLCGTRADNTVIYREANSFENNIVEITFENAELAAKGTAKYKIEIKNTSGDGQTQLLTSTHFNVKVYENIYDENGKLASPQYSDLQKELEKIREEEKRIEEAETGRSQAEAVREENESARQSAEASREENESARQSTETARVQNENDRVESESQRAQAEANRKEQENTRESTEAARAEAENKREKNETQRQSNEQQRQDDTSAAIESAQAAAKKANDAADDLQSKLDSFTQYTHPDSGVSAGTYRSVTVNAQGHVTAGNTELIIPSISSTTVGAMWIE